MIKNFYYLFASITLGIALTFTACSKNEEINQQETLEARLSSIEKLVSNIESNKSLHKIKNKKMIDWLNKVKSGEIKNTDNNSFSRDEENSEITEEEQLIYESYFNSINTNENVNPIDINIFYLDMIEDIVIDQSKMDRLTSTLITHRDLMIYFDFGTTNESNRGNNCGHRDCFDCCMYYKLKEIEDANLVDQVVFVLTIAESTAQMAVSCGWDCMFNQ